jgi:subtilisin family serine protease
MVVLLTTACTTDRARSGTAPDGVAPSPKQRSAEPGIRAKVFEQRVVALNAEVARASHVDVISPGGGAGFALTGAGVLVAQWDEGAPRETHRDLLGRAEILDGSGLSDHASHVAGTIAGAGALDPLALGMAPGARLFSYSWELDLVELAGVGPFVSASSHAYGEALGWQASPQCPEPWSWAGEGAELEDARFGRYGAVARALDGAVHARDLLPVFAAGNDRADGPASPGERHAHLPTCDAIFDDKHAPERELEYDTLGEGAVAKNVLTVGAVVDLAADFTASDITPLAVSSFGPTDDGRIKPDVVAGGDDVRSIGADTDDAYVDRSGTSSAAAAVTGIAALLVEQYRAERAGRDPRASELKAVLVQTALDPGAPGPDYGMGYGLVDARRAAEYLAADASDGRLRVDIASVDANELVTSEIAEGTALRVTLAWLDPPGPIRQALDDPTSVLENDLDLSLVAPDGTTVFHAWSLDPERPDAPATRDGPNRLDNVEVVDVDASKNDWTGSWTLRVEAARPLLRNEPQAYALAASVPISTPRRVVVGSATRVAMGVAPNGTTTLSLPISNLGRGTLEWTASSDAPFLELEKSTGIAGEDLVLRAVGRNLAPLARGFAEVTLESNEPGSSRMLGVLVETPCEPDCRGIVCGPDPACGTTCGRCAPEFACTNAGTCAPFGSGCPAADLGSALGSAVVSGTTAGPSRLATSCGGELGADVAFAWTAPRPGRYVFSTEGSAFDTILSVRHEGCDSSEIACNDDTLDLTSSVIVELDAGEPVTAVVDGFDGARGAFSLGIHALTCPDGKLGSKLGYQVLPAATPGRLDRLQASCAPEAARETTLEFTAPADGVYRFDASASSYEASIAVLRDDCAGEELACASDAVEVSMFAGARVIVVIDGARSPEDRFSLSITTRSLSCGGDCNAKPGGGLCACDERCVELGDCCVDACGDCASCTPEQECEFGRCIPRRCPVGDCECTSSSGGTGPSGCDAGAGGVPGEAGGPTSSEPVRAVEPSGCTCTAAGHGRSKGLLGLGILAALALLASRRGRI